MVNPTHSGQLEQLSLLAPQSEYTEPFVQDIYQQYTIIGNYGMQASTGYAELQVLTDGKEIALLHVSKQFTGVLAFLPACKLRWHNVAAKARKEYQRSKVVSLLSCSTLTKPIKECSPLYTGLYNDALGQYFDYYDRVLELLHTNLLDLTDSGKHWLVKRDLEFVATQKIAWRLPLDFALFVLGKAQEHYKPQRFDYFPKIRRDFVRIAKYKDGIDLNLTKEALTVAIAVGSLGNTGVKL